MRSKTGFFTILLIFLAGTAWGGPVLAQEVSAESRIEREFLGVPEFRDLKLHLDRVYESEIGEPKVGEMLLGELLIQAALRKLEDLNTLKEQERERIRTEIRNGFFSASTARYLGSWLKDRIKIFREEIRDTGAKVKRDKGMKFLITWASWEVTEMMIRLYWISHPTNWESWALLAPVTESHVGDKIVVVSTYFAPQIWGTLKAWRAHGGLLRGPGSLYAHYVKQRLIQPIDWSVVLAKHRSGAVVLSENWFERQLPEALRKVLAPRKMAQKQAVSWVNFKELEEIASRHSVSIESLEPAKGNRREYAVLLFKKIEANLEARAELSDLFFSRLPTTNVFVDQLVDSPDLSAQKIVRGLERRRTAFLMRALVRGWSKEERTLWRQLNRELNGDLGLAMIQRKSYPEPTEANWQELRAASNRAHELLEKLEESFGCGSAFH